MWYSSTPGQLPRASKISTMYLRDRKDPKEEERYKKKKKNSHTSNAILQQTIPFCFQNAWYYYREAMFMFSNKLTRKTYHT